MKRITILAALAVFAHTAKAEVIRIRDNGGGSILQFAAAVAALDSRGDTVRIGGTCGSACTLYLSAQSYCVERGARLKFHAARFEGNDKAARLFTRYMFSKYPPAVQGWIARNGGLTTKLITLKGAELRGIVRICK